MIRTTRTSASSIYVNFTWSVIPVITNICKLLQETIWN